MGHNCPLCPGYTVYRRVQIYRVHIRVGLGYLRNRIPTQPGPIYQLQARCLPLAVVHFFSGRRKTLSPANSHLHRHCRRLSSCVRLKSWLLFFCIQCEKESSREWVVEVEAVGGGGATPTLVWPCTSHGLPFLFMASSVLRAVPGLLLFVVTYSDPTSPFFFKIT